MRDFFVAFFEQFGCKKSKIRVHDFQWSLGPDVPVQEQHGLLVQVSTFGGPGEWWLYCTKCGRKAFDD